jgi:hypothetical protein
MPLSASDLLHDADAFRHAYPHWPSAEPEERAMTLDEAREHAGDGGHVVEVFPCADTPYRCDGFDPADWPGDVPDFSALAFLNQPAEPADIAGRSLDEMVRDERMAEAES